jgi:adenylate cyclase class 2
MRPEIEAKFLNINHDKIRQKLLTVGARCVQPMRLMKRITIDTPIMESKHGWMRVRDEGDKVTLSYKQTDSLTINGTKEIEVKVSSFNDAVALLAEAGLVQSSFQESKRETWMLGSVEVVLDEWPWLNPYIEIEAMTERQVIDIAEKLGLVWKDAYFGDVTTAYRAQYPSLGMEGTLNLAQVKFNDPLPEILKNH